MATSCEFDRLFTKSVPHILEKIFLFLDCKSFLNCLEVSRSWNDVLTSEPIQRMGKSVFGEDIVVELMQAAEEGTTNRVKRILSSGLADMNYFDEIYLTPLHEAARKGHKDVVQLLLDSGMEHDNCISNLTPLFCSAEAGHKDVVRLLLDRGAEPNKADGFYRTPLHLTAQRGHKAVVKLLLDGGAEPSIESYCYYGFTPLQYAAMEGHNDIVQLFLDRGANPSTAGLTG